jgi:uridylate kinase
MYKRVLIKLSGEAMQGDQEQGFDYKIIKRIAEEIRSLQEKDYEIALVIGAGNIWRYRDTKESNIIRTRSDALGMTATVMNAVVLQSALESIESPTEIYSSFPIPKLTQDFLADKAKLSLKDKKIVLCAGGTGNPYFTTDSAAALRALELQCDVIIKATTVDGIYNKDPNIHNDAVKYDNIRFTDAIQQNLKIMDTSAFALCEEEKLPIIVLNMYPPGNIAKALQGEKIGTLVSE